jgi:PTH2 family peptidyl-tRNA hydrolase
MYKQVIVARTNIKMSPGKLAAQVAHASVEAYKRADRKTVRAWQAEGSKKVVLRGEGARELFELRRKALASGIACALIKDAGRTELPSGTITCLGIGPGPESRIDMITGKLRILR